MVNSKNVAFKVNKQTPSTGPPPQAYGTVINCRKPGGKRALRAEREVKSQRVRLTKIAGSEDLDVKPPKRPEDEIPFFHPGFQPINGHSAEQSTSLAYPVQPPPPGLPSRVIKPTKFRRGKVLSKGVDIDSWHTILSFSDPAQLLELRTKISSCYRFLRDYPMLWKHSRAYYYRNTLPDPPSELTEFQYAHLRHGHGCMSCGTPSTRKTYWAFLRRWCKACLHARTVKEGDTGALFKDENGEDIFFLRKCLPAGIFDSWGNFVGVGPATTHSLKTVYLTSDVQKLCAEYSEAKKQHGAAWATQMPLWIAAKVKSIQERQEFARKMELWEDMTRQSKSSEHNEKKAARKTFYIWKASQIVPPITVRELELCPSYRRATAIPKDPNMTSWLQLKPKLEREVIDVRAKAGPSTTSVLPSTTSILPIYPASGTSTPSTEFRY